MLSGLLYAVAANASVQSLLIAYGNSRSLQTRKQRWTADGTMARLMEAGAPVIERMRNEYWGRVRNASFVGEPTCKTSPEFFGRGAIPRLPHMQAKGRYADRRR